ncbi:hypothetical protein PG997_000147 [Apiospora hydei]|uniref:Uncharacterized protein n=1 Tax=Apiospora hydei TaxID=1337664 RepID=A0ABR1X9Y4_9PEZI
MPGTYHLCYSAEVHFISSSLDDYVRLRTAQVSSEHPKVSKVRYDPDNGFQLDIETDVSLSSPECCKGSVGKTADKDVLEAQIRIVFVLTDTEPESEQAITDGVRRGLVTHNHNDGQYSDLMATLVAGGDDRMRLAAGLVFEGDAAGRNFSDEMERLSRRIQQKLYDLVMEAKEVPGEAQTEFLGMTGDQVRKEQLRGCLLGLYRFDGVLWDSLARLRKLCADNEGGKM